VRIWFRAFAFKCNLYRYEAETKQAIFENTAYNEVGLCRLNQVDP
jgi:hypothetical protein